MIDLILDSLIDDGLIPSPMTDAEREHARLCVERAFGPATRTIAALRAALEAAAKSLETIARPWQHSIRDAWEYANHRARVAREALETIE